MNLEKKHRKKNNNEGFYYLESSLIIIRGLSVLNEKFRRELSSSRRLLVSVERVEVENKCSV